MEVDDVECQDDETDFAVPRLVRSVSSFRAATVVISECLVLFHWLVLIAHSTGFAAHAELTRMLSFSTWKPMKTKIRPDLVLLANEEKSRQSESGALFPLSSQLEISLLLYK